MRRKHLHVLVIATALLATAMIGAALIVPSSAQDTDAATADRTISVDAVGQAESDPDQAVVRVAVTAVGDDPATVRDTLIADSETLRENLEAAGIAEEDYETKAYRIHERRRPPREEREDSPTYRGVHAFEVTLDDPEAVGAVIDAAADANAEVANVEFTLSEDRRKELRSTAIDDAMTDARMQADTIAENGDLRVTGVASVDATQRNFRPVRHDAVAVEASADGASTVVESGTVSVTYQVRVTYNATAGR
jgi:uncharacterized protein YggE